MHRDRDYRRSNRLDHRTVQCEPRRTTAYEEELRAAVDAYVRDEMLYREGLALGLDRDDPVVRNRIRQKADLLSDA